MATQASIDTVQKAYIAYYGRPADPAGLAFWADRLDNEEGGFDALIEQFGNSEEAQTLFGGLENAEIVETLYQQILGREADATGLEFYVEQLEAGTMSAVSIAQNILDGVNMEDPVDGALLANRIAVAERFTAALDTEAEQNAYAGDEAAATVRAMLSGVDADTNVSAFEIQPTITALVDAYNPEEPGEPTNPGDSFVLTVDQDMVTGTDGDDTITSYIFDNQNTFQSGDMIAAGQGNDTLVAEVGNSQNFAITAKTDSVENVFFRAQASATDAADNDVSDDSIDTQVQIDAQDMVGLAQVWSLDSRANLVVEDIRIADHEITEDITIGMRNTDAGDVNYEVYFEDNSLRAAPDAQEGAQLNIRLMDLLNAETGEYLKEDPYVGFTFSIDGVQFRVESEAIKAATNYDELLVAIQDAVAATEGLENFSVEKTGVFTRADADGVVHQGDVITLTNNGSGVITEGGWLIGEDGVPGNSNLVAEQDNTSPDQTGFLITSNVVLDNVGRGSTAGDLVIGNMSQGTYSGSTGVQQFNVEVQRDSSLANMRSTANSLEVVNVVNGEGFEGDLRLVGASQPITGSDQDKGADAVKDAYGLFDVRVFNADEMQGDVTLNALISEDSVAKYLDLVDDQADAAADNIDFNYTTGSGDDTLVLDVSEEAAAHEDFELAIDTGAGDDYVKVDLVDDAGNLDLNWLADQQMLNNYTISTGAGNDTVWSKGEGDARINTGSGDDNVYTDNTGDKSVWIYNAQNTDLNDVLGKPVATALLHNATLTVNFAGFEETVNIPTEDLLGDSRSINQALKDAINNDRVLGELLTARDGANNSLVVTSNIDGVFTETELSFGINTVDVNDLTSAEKQDITEYLQGQANNSNLTITDADIQAALNNGSSALLAAYGQDVLAVAGTDSVKTSNNVVNVETGDDLIVLGTGTGADTVTFTGYDNNKVTIVHFDQGIDTLNFSSYLDTVISTSGSTISQQPAGGVANNVNMLTFTATEAEKEAGETFANLTADKLLDALKENQSDYANIDGSTLNGLRSTIADLVGNDRDHIVGIENGDNPGEFKYFHVVSTENADGEVEFTSANFISTVDFGTFTGSNGGGTTNPPTGTDTVDVTAAGTYDASAVDATFNVNAGAYTYTVDGFGAGDVLDIFAGAAISVINSDGTDGSVTVQAADANTGAVTNITLTGLSTADDSALFNTASFDNVFGAGTII